MNVITNKIRFSVIGIVVSALCTVPVAMGGNLTIPKSWIAEETLTSADLNGNFQAIEAAVDDNSFSLDAADGSPVDALTVDNDGNVQVATTLSVLNAPTDSLIQLAVTGSAHTTRGMKLGGTTGSRSGLLELRNTVPWSSVISATDQNNVQLFNLNNSGAVTVLGTVTAAGHATVSDSRYKRNIVTLENPLEKLLELRGVSFMWDTDKYTQFRSLPGKQVGFVAQEVKNVLPETVFENEDGYLAVSYNAIVPLLVEAVKEQQLVIKKLTKEVGSIELLREEMRELRQQISVIQAKNDNKHAVDKQRLSLINN